MLFRSAAEIDHAHEMRKIERKRIDDKLDADKREWKKLEQEEMLRFEAERTEPDAALKEKAEETAK